ncbi:hypothetical protein ASG43_00255 [Aureimonas sp. Leaf454]|uniref:hypothetical protein n=1 Tax=Aureimonas sp. Leaf454 TaxID=1736381 RepID=UPI0006F25182|nr:hypothetical protein [Aureimonas sp. Leaf454]KQT54104.1 hypothetical protein ASG43_00255 [Aureimonas sp. Leaf454]
MTREASAGWRFLPPPIGAGNRFDAANDLLAAQADGPAALSRALRSSRDLLGAARTAAQLRALPNRPGQTIRLLFAAPIQPQSLLDALEVAFGIAGLRPDVELVDGFAPLAGRSERNAGVDLAVLLDPSAAAPQGEAGVRRAEGEPTLRVLADELSARLHVPVALVQFGSGLAERALGANTDLLDVGIAPADAFDGRFSASFGTILKPAAADRVADAVAGWAARRAGRAPKLLVTDLDGTLWAGILGERADGEATPPLNRAYADALRTLVERGIVLAVASRNETVDVEAAFATGAAAPLSRGDVAAMAVGWEDKALLVERVLSRTGLASEHAVFIDDDPVNCAKVAARYPDMDVRLFAGDPDDFAARLLCDPLLLGGDAEGAARAERYQAKAGVERLRAEAPDIGAFLSALGTRLTFRRLGTGDLRRAAELSGRVNQFILNEMRPSAPALAERHSAFDLVVRLDDAFGSHGIVGLILASPAGDALLLDNLYLSCRALERGVEDAMLAGLSDLARRAGHRTIAGRVAPLSRNAPAQAFVARLARLAADGSFDYPVGESALPAQDAPEIRWQLDEDEA